jgi:hypothetical protein
MRAFLRTCAWALTSLAGLSGGGPVTGSVTGRVLFRGQPLPGGRIFFVTEDGRLLSAELGEDGTYTLADLPPGTLRVGLHQTRLPRQLPANYGDPNTSGLRATIQPGSQRLNFNLHWHPARNS